MEKLTIQHIAAFGDKKLKALKNVTGENKIVTIEGYVKGEGGEYLFFKGDDGSVGNYSPEYFKPYMHHISCLTKTIQHEGTEFIPIVELAKIFQRNIDWGFVVDKAVFSHWKNSSKLNFWYCNRYKSFLATRENKFLGKWAGETITKVNNQYQLFQKLAEWHINFVGIPEHLYINKETIKTKL